ncbi:MAG: hypothetical protein M3Q10_02020 [Chloroflexota bacterium]|nr:hypothetical protein [Chloroflexota bacterium]
MVSRLMRRLVSPAAIFVGVAIVVAVLVIVIGEVLLSLHPEEFSSELARPDLWAALIGAVAILAACAFLATRPRGSLGLLDREVAIGGRPMFAPEPPPIDLNMRRGPAGSVADIAEGFTLYARNGPLARVIGMLPGEEEYGRRRRGIIYASGLYGASDELWIPVEAVLAVYPETRSAFLAVKGDETEHFGWNRAPQSFRRTPHASHFPSAN